MTNYTKIMYSQVLFDYGRVVFWVILLALVVLVLVGIMFFIVSKIRTKDKEVVKSVDGIIKSDNEFVVKREEIEKEGEIKKLEIEEQRMKDEELIKKDPLEYIRKRF